MPNVIFKKFIGSIAIGCVCLLVGAVCFAAYSDRTMFLLSMVISAVTFVKAYSIYRQFKNGDYITITGTCIKVSRPLFSRHKTVYIETDADTIQLYLPKEVKLYLNEKYVFYFKKKPADTTLILNSYMTSKLNTDNFLGCEQCYALECEKQAD